MKRFLSTILALFALCGVSNAQVSALNVGYCNGKVKTASTKGFTSKEKDTWISGAIFLPASKLQVYAGNHIDSIHAGLASAVNIDSLRVWVRTSLDGEDLASGALNKTDDPKLKRGWNTVGLNAPYSITGEEGLYIGYSFHQKGAAVGLSILNQPQENALFVKLGSDSAWVDRSDAGALACEALVYGDNLPKYNLALESITPQEIFVIDKGTYTVNALVRNLATATITGIDATLLVDDLEEPATAHADCNVAYGEEQEVEFTFYPTITTNTPADRTFTFTLSKFDEGDDEDMSDNTLTGSFSVVRHDFTRNVLLEEFTTEKCVNCPRVAGYVEDILANDEFKGRVFQVEHHSGYYTDQYTQPFDNEYLWFYNAGGSTYAPGIMLDRALVASESTPVYCPSSEDQLKTGIRERMATSAFVSLNLKATLDEENNELHVNVTGERSKSDFTKNPARITVFLLEDNLDGSGQANGSTGFMHHHTGRKVNSTWGEVLEWDGDEYSYDYTFTVENYYKQENLEVVAFVSDFDEDDAKACEVANSAYLSASDFESATAINDLQGVAPQSEDRYYSIDGRSLTAPQRGINIVRHANGTTQKIVIR
ncbi:MAG: Omp28-related outer membrane protein [Prevotella sp.]|jgi:hypothetical protein